MGREVRMVPAGWEHPKDEKGNYIPLLEGPFSKAVAEWDEEAAQWADGRVLDYSVWPDKRAFKPKDNVVSETFEEYNGERPTSEDYMPEFPEGAATHFCMYEDVSEGTPISPPFATPEELARWLADNEASAFGRMTATYDQWLATIHRGSAVSMVLSSAGLQSGVAAQ